MRNWYMKALTSISTVWFLFPDSLSSSMWHSGSLFSFPSPHTSLDCASVPGLCLSSLPDDSLCLLFEDEPSAVSWLDRSLLSLAESTCVRHSLIWELSFLLAIWWETGWEWIRFWRSKDNSVQKITVELFILIRMWNGNIYGENATGFQGYAPNRRWTWRWTNDFAASESKTLDFSNWNMSWYPAKVSMKWVLVSIWDRSNSWEVALTHNYSCAMWHKCACVLSYSYHPANSSFLRPHHSAVQHTRYLPSSAHTHGWLGNLQGSNSWSAGDQANVFLLRHLEVTLISHLRFYNAYY